MITMIVAMDLKRAIGKDNHLLFSIPDDMKHFVRTTKGKTVVMGRKTYDSIGKPLQNRKNIIMTRTLNPDIKGCYQTSDIGDILRLDDDGEDIFIIGGAEIYRQFMPYADQLIVTHVYAEVTDADAFFPEIYENEWESAELIEQNMKSYPIYSIVRYVRIKSPTII